MKRVALLLAVALASVAVFAQKINKSELKQLQVFLSEPAEKDATNAQALKITDTGNPATWEGVTVEGGHITAIEWKDKHLAGTLNLSGFTALTKVDVSRNKITALTVKGSTALTELNASRNRLNEFDAQGCSSLHKHSVNNNYIT